MPCLIRSQTGSCLTNADEICSHRCVARCSRPETMVVALLPAPYQSNIAAMTGNGAAIDYRPLFNTVMARVGIATGTDASFDMTK